MYYTIYKITNKINGKFYIGKHQTNDLHDDYMGSGKLIKSAIEKYGVENFKKEILYVFDNENDMNDKESELVTEEFVKDNNNYNLCPGGNGGWGYINLNEDLRIAKNRLARKRADVVIKEKYGVDNYTKTEQYKKYMSNKIKEQLASGERTVSEKFIYAFKGKHHSDETKQIVSKKAKERLRDPSKNSQYGTMWITDGLKNKKIKRGHPIPEGWYKGRKMKQQ